MTERLLQYIWQFKYFNGNDLVSTTGNRIQIIHPGQYNTNQGPDFLNAKVLIDDTVWAGSIEIHINSSEWLSHNHSADGNYKNVILHVVWFNDKQLNLGFPVLELHDRVSGILLQQYDELMQSPLFIPCQQQINNVDEVVLNTWKERMLIERLQQRTDRISSLLQLNNYHWEEVFWWLLARNFGMKVNADSFEKIAQSIPLNLLSRHRNRIIQLEALLLGQAGLLDKIFTDSYPNMLRKEYDFLKKKFRLQKVHYPLYFLRMRPANFPTVRLAQLASLIHNSHQLFSVIREESSLKELLLLFDITANDYWHYHYRFDEETSFCKKIIGKQMAENIIMNTVVPVVFAYGHVNSLPIYKEKALQWMHQLTAEKNAVTKGFAELGLSIKNASDSQAYIQLKTEYCNYRHCLNCAIGNNILKLNI